MSGDSALQHLRQQVQEAAATRSALRIRGGGSKDFLGEALHGDILDMRPLSGVIEYDPSELVITVRAGTSLAEVEATLASRGQYLAFEPPDFGGCATMGGVVAAGLSGPRRVTAGGIRDFVLGADLLSSGGDVLHFGGRVMKNVAGFDISRVLCGSLGILGPIVAVSLKVLPCPRHETTVARELSEQAAIRWFNECLRRPMPVSATSWFDGDARVRVSGSPSVVALAARALGGRIIEPVEAADWWRHLRHHAIPFFANREPVWRVSVPALAATLPLDGGPLVEWGGALRWYPGSLDAQVVREAACALGGSAALWYAERTVPMFDQLAPPNLAIHRRLKERFDPAGIFNRDRLVLGL